MSDLIHTALEAAQGSPLLAAAAAAAALALAWRARKPKPFRLRPSGPREPGVVYLHMFRRWKFSPNASPYCVKLETYLRLAGVPYVVVASDTADGPSGRMPWIELDGEAIADSEVIIDTLERRLGPSGLARSGAGHAVDVMLSDRTTWVAVHNRWIRHTPRVFTDMIRVPKPVEYFIRWSVLPRVAARGLGHGIFAHDEEGMDRLARSDLAAVSELLGGGRYLLGDRPSVHDASVFATLSLFLSDNFPHPAKEQVRDEFGNLHEYYLRLKEELYPDWDTLRRDPADKVYRPRGPKRA